MYDNVSKYPNAQKGSEGVRNLENPVNTVNARVYKKLAPDKIEMCALR